MNKFQTKHAWTALAALLALASVPTVPTLVGAASFRSAPSHDDLLARRIILYKDGAPSENA